MVSLQGKVKPNSYPEVCRVNEAVTWWESESTYPRRSHGREAVAERSKACREKSAEAIVPDGHREGLKYITGGIQRSRIHVETLNVARRRAWTFHGMEWKGAVEQWGGRPRAYTSITQHDEQVITLESILDRDNLNAAYLQVCRNKGAAGVDGMEVQDLLPHLKEHGQELVKSLREGTYRPLPVRRVLIPKEEKGKFRPLGIPTVVDRMVQQAVAQRLSELYEGVFSPNSHGFRPNRSCHTAIRQALEYANQGYTWVVDLDLAKFFDTVNHSKLLQLLGQTCESRLVSLIHKMLRAPIVENDKQTPSTMGTPQGGCVSPVLANILLHELDSELTRRGLRFVRYADDMMIFCKSKKAGLRVFAHIQPFIEQKLFLKLNVQKSKIVHICSHDLKFLGFGFHQRRTKEGNNAIVPVVHQKAKAKCKEKLRALTQRNCGRSAVIVRQALTLFIRGWVNYYGIAQMKAFLRGTDEWLRRRIRQYYWKQWKRTTRRNQMLRLLKATPEKAWQWANTRKSYWAIAGSAILSSTLTSAYLRKQGWPTLSQYYEQALA